jgi:hypothetical protein
MAAAKRDDVTEIVDAVLAKLAGILEMCRNVVELQRRAYWLNGEVNKIDRLASSLPPALREAAQWEVQRVRDQVIIFTDYVRTEHEERSKHLIGLAEMGQSLRQEVARSINKFKALRPKPGNNALRINTSSVTVTLGEAEDERSIPTGKSDEEDQAV